MGKDHELMRSWFCGKWSSRSFHWSFQRWLIITSQIEVRFLWCWRSGCCEGGQVRWLPCFDQWWRSRRSHSQNMAHRTCWSRPSSWCVDWKMLVLTRAQDCRTSYWTVREDVGLDLKGVVKVMLHERQDDDEAVLRDQRNRLRAISRGDDEGKISTSMEEVQTYSANRRDWCWCAGVSFQNLRV